MQLSRRDFLAGATAALAATSLSGCGRNDAENRDLPPSRTLPPPSLLRNSDNWDEVRDQFTLSADYIHMSALYVSSHPKVIRDAIQRYRDEIDSDPVTNLNRQNRRRINEVLEAAATYLGVASSADISLTDSTTMGLGLVYSGLRLAKGDEILSTTHDYYATHEALRLAALRNGLVLRQVSLYDRLHAATEDSMTAALIKAINPRTRVLALTWVHSGNGLKLPLQRIASEIQKFNAARAEQNQILLCVDGVHGFGVEDVTMTDLGCDFFIAGCHKWLFGPRGTGLIWGSPRGWENILPTIPSFYDDDARQAWMSRTSVNGPVSGRGMSPGGFKPFEHQWALKEAFALHQEIGKARVAARTHELAGQLKQGLQAMKHIRLQTPLADNLSSGIVCFDVGRMHAFRAVRRLRERGIIATVTPYAVRHVRLAPSIRNSPAEVDTVLREIHALR